MFREVTEIDTMNLQKQVYDADDIQKLLGIGRSKAYAFLDEAYESQKPFRVIKESCTGFPKRDSING